MSYHWPAQDIDLEYFSPDEFNHPELLEVTFLRDLDTLRMRCGFPLRVTSDGRTLEELENLYAKEIAKGLPWPAESSHVALDGHLVRACDLKPVWTKGAARTLDEMELELTYQVLKLWKEGRWPHLGLGIETGHWHVDDTPRLGSKRPSFWVAISR